MKANMKKTRRFPTLEWDRSTDTKLPEPIEFHRVSTVPAHPDQDILEQQANALFLGDNLQVMASLLPSLESKLRLIYADPPFLTGKSYLARIGSEEDSRLPSQWETTDGYQDKWLGAAEYLDMLFARLQCMYQLLAPDGTLYLHLDWHASAYARLLLDEIFGPDRLLNEIVWVYHGPSPIRSAFKRKHDTILVYTKSDDYLFNADDIRVPYDPSTHKTFASSARAGFGKIPNLERGKVPEDWWYFPVVARLHRERTGYPTQKPQALLERIIRASSNPGDIVGDFFCGSGTTLAVAEQLGRGWIGCDLVPMAIHTAYRRLLMLGRRAGFRVLATAPPEIGRAGHALFHISQNATNVEIDLSDRSSLNSTPLQEDLDIWEVDWNFDGLNFRSQSHSVRPWRKKPMHVTLSHNYAQKGEYTICVRVTDSFGACFQEEQSIMIGCPS